MTRPFDPRSFEQWDERQFDLAFARYSVGLDARDQAELESQADAAELEGFERVVVALHLAATGSLEAPPRALMDRIGTDGLRVLGLDPRPDAVEGSQVQARGPAASPAGSGLATWAGWLAAAALLVVLLLRGREQTGTPVTGVQELVARATDLLQAEWSATEDPLAAGVSGDVVWSSERQEGYMRFRGLEANDPTRNQYQLWIFDPTRADWEERPVDGGVFDVTVDADGEVVVPIEPKLEVRQAALFAVTLEVPGGVVVSKRERLVLTAAPE